MAAVTVILMTTGTYIYIPPRQNTKNATYLIFAIKDFY